MLSEGQRGSGSFASDRRFEYTDDEREGLLTASDCGDDTLTDDGFTCGEVRESTTDGATDTENEGFV